MARDGGNEIDWAAVRRWYEQGHTRDECMRRFGFSKRSWRGAVDLGLVTPRPAGTQVGPAATRTRVGRLLAEGKSYNEIASALGVSKSTVAFHARRLGRPVDDRFNRRYDWDEVQRAHDGGMRAAECQRTFGFSPATWTSAVRRGDIVPNSHLIPLNELLVAGRGTSRGHLKARLVAAGLKPESCEECGITEWQGQGLSMHLHHRNGDGTDNRLENLQLLCPNCHSQTDTYGGRNGHRRPERHLELVEPPPEEDSEKPTGT